LCLFETPLVVAFNFTQEEILHRTGEGRDRPHGGGGGIHNKVCSQNSLSQTVTIPRPFTNPPWRCFCRAPPAPRRTSPRVNTRNKSWATWPTVVGQRSLRPAAQASRSDMQLARTSKNQTDDLTFRVACQAHTCQSCCRHFAPLAPKMAVPSASLASKMAVASLGASVAECASLCDHSMHYRVKLGSTHST